MSKSRAQRERANKQTTQETNWTNINLYNTEEKRGTLASNKAAFTKRSLALDSQEHRLLEFRLNTSSDSLEKRQVSLLNCLKPRCYSYL